MSYIGKTPTPAPLTSSDITDGIITTTKIANDAATLAKMAQGTDGNIISYDANGNPVAVATGNDGQVLTSTGAGSPPAFENASGGANTPIFFGNLGGGNQSVPVGQMTKLLVTEILDPSNTFASNKWTPAVAGYYWLFAGVTQDNASGNTLINQVRIYKNGTNIGMFQDNASGNPIEAFTTWNQQLVLLDDDDYIEFYVYCDTADSANGLFMADSRFGGYKLIT